MESEIDIQQRRLGEDQAARARYQQLAENAIDPRVRDAAWETEKYYSRQVSRRLIALAAIMGAQTRG